MSFEKCEFEKILIQTLELLIACIFFLANSSKKVNIVLLISEYFL